MILLRQFMGWVTALRRTPKQTFQALHWRLLLSYLTVMAAILGTSATAVYVFFTRNLEQQSNSHLLTLAEAAAPSLNDQLLSVAEAAVGSSETIKIGSLQSLTQESPWNNLVQRSQSLEWFNADGKLLVREGASLPTLPLEKGSRVIQQGEIRAVTIAVFSDRPGQNRQLEGYIRASESTEEEEVVLTRLTLGLGFGGIIALILSTIGSLWLTEQALRPVEQSFQQLKQFTGDASHELRSPLTVIRTAVAVIFSHPERIHPLDTKKVFAIASATEQMIHLTEDLLFLARNDTVMPPLVFEQIPLSLNDIVQDLVERLNPQAQAKEIALKSDLLAEVSIIGNAAQLNRLFSNLLENALQYTLPGGSVVLSIATQNRLVVVSVKDTGIGVAPEHLSLIFQRFWRADTARSQRVGGLGLGLAIAQTIAQRHRGKVTVSSEIGVGSCFQVWLPTVQSTNF